MNRNEKTTKVITVIGIIIVAFGAVQLAKMFLGPWWSTITQIYGYVSTFVWAALAVALGIALIMYARKGLPQNLSGRTLARSSSDKWVAGVLGGLAAYFGIDSTILRLIYILFIIANFWFAGLVYVVGILIMPRDTSIGV